MHEQDRPSTPTGRCPASRLGHVRGELRALVCADGRKQAKWSCALCGELFGGAVKMLRGHVDRLPVARVNAPPDAVEMCSVYDCDRPGVEQHHWAPRERFGADAGLWPSSALCTEHHQLWHDRIAELTPRQIEQLLERVRRALTVTALNPSRRVRP